MVYQTTALGDSQSTVSDSTDASIITVIEDNPSQEVASTSSFTLVTALSDDIVNTDYSCQGIELYCIDSVSYSYVPNWLMMS